jgi:hypothetical protein
MCNTKAETRVQAKIVMRAMERKPIGDIVLPLRIYPNREDSILITRRSGATTKQSPHVRGDCFGGRTPPRNDSRVRLRLEAAI